MDNPKRLYATDELVRTIRSQGRMQIWIANLIGKQRSYITHVINRRLTVSFADGQRIADALGVDVHVLFESADAVRREEVMA